MTHPATLERSKNANHW